MRDDDEEIIKLKYQIIGLNVNVSKAISKPQRFDLPCEVSTKKPSEVSSSATMTTRLTVKNENDKG